VNEPQASQSCGCVLYLRSATSWDAEPSSTLPRWLTLWKNPNIEDVSWMGDVTTNKDNSQVYKGNNLNTVGSPSTPVYVDSDGQVKQCDPSTFAIADGAVTTAKIANGAVSRDKIAASALPKILSATCNESEVYTTNNQFFEIGSITDNELSSRIADISLSGKIKLPINAGSSFDVIIYVYDTDVFDSRLIETRTITVVGSDKNYFNERFLIEKNLLVHGSVNFFVRINLSGEVRFSEKRLKGILL
jgi:hypothetical protein